MKITLTFTDSIVDFAGIMKKVVSLATENVTTSLHQYFFKVNFYGYKIMNGSVAFKGFSCLQRSYIEQVHINLKLFTCGSLCTLPTVPTITRTSVPRGPKDRLACVI